jgi:flavin-dependent dehydrogenase
MVAARSIPAYSHGVEQRVDAVVVGAGPAGAVTAIVLADLGWRTMLIERRGRGRGKCCGHCLNPRALPMLESIGAGSIAADARAGAVERLHIHLPGGGELALAVRAGRCGASGLVVERDRFDQGLRDLAASRGVTLVQGETARVLGRDAQGVRMAIGRGGDAVAVRCGLVVGADGLRSRVAMDAGLAARSGDSGAKFGFSFDLPGASSSRFDWGTVHMFVDEQGYVGVVASEAGDLHVAALVGRRARGRGGPRAFCQRMSARFPRLERAGLADAQPHGAGRFHAAAPMPWRPRARANHWAALVGDAAGYVEPFTGEGMSWAIESALLLGEAARSLAPGAWSHGAAAAYERRWRARIGAGHRVCSAIAWMLERSSACAMLARLGGRHPARAEQLMHRLVPA